MVKIFENDLFFIRDDIESGIDVGIVLDDNFRRYSVFSKVPYRRLIVYNGSKEWAVEQFWLNYDKFVEEIENE